MNSSIINKIKNFGLIAFTLIFSVTLIGIENIKELSPEIVSEKHNQEVIECTFPEFKSRQEVYRTLINKEPEPLENEYQIYKKDYLVQKMTMLSPKTIWEMYQIPVLSRSGLTKEQLEKGLSGELKQYAGDFLLIEEKYGINAVFFAAICATESGWGKKPVARNNYMSWTTDTVTYFEFDTPYECFEYGAIRLKSAFLLSDGSCYSGDYIKDVNQKYAINPDGSVNTQWYKTVTDVACIILDEAYK